MSWPVVALGSVVTFLDQLRRPITAKDRIAGPFPYYGANGQQDSVNSYIFDEPLVLLAEDGGHFDEPQKGVAYRIDGPSWVNNHAHVLRPDESVDVEYLARVLENYDLRPFISGSTRGKLTKASAARVRIPLPPLPEQRRIASILDQTDALRTKRRRALALLDELANSIFIEMFGDPAREKHRWENRPLGSLAVKYSDGPFGSNLKSSDYTPTGVRVIRLQNIGAGKFLDRDRAYISDQHYRDLERHECLPGDVLIGTLGEPNLRACLQPDGILRAINKADCVQFRADQNQVTPQYIVGLLNQPSVGRMAESLILGQTRGRISMGRLRSFEVPTPPLGLQREYSNRVLAAEEAECSHRTHLAKLDELFVSLQHRAFRGEL